MIASVAGMGHQKETGLWIDYSGGTGSTPVVSRGFFALNQRLKSSRTPPSMDPPHRSVCAHDSDRKIDSTLHGHDSAHGKRWPASRQPGTRSPNCPLPQKPMPHRNPGTPSANSDNPKAGFRSQPSLCIENKESTESATKRRLLAAFGTKTGQWESAPFQTPETARLHIESMGKSACSTLSYRRWDTDDQ